jgi:hypothetical protein
MMIAVTARGFMPEDGASPTKNSKHNDAVNCNHAGYPENARAGYEEVERTKDEVCCTLTAFDVLLNQPRK